MNGNSNICPQPVEMLRDGQYQVRWNIQRNDRVSIPDSDQVENYDFEYNTKYFAKSISQKEVMLAIIRERYDSSDEIALAMKRAEDAAKLQEHEDYISFARTTARQLLTQLNETIQ